MALGRLSCLPCELPNDERKARQVVVRALKDFGRAHEYLGRMGQDISRHGEYRKEVDRASLHFTGILADSDKFQVNGVSTNTLIASFFGTRLDEKGMALKYVIRMNDNTQILHRWHTPDMSDLINMASLFLGVVAIVFALKLKHGGGVDIRSTAPINVFGSLTSFFLASTIDDWVSKVRLKLDRTASRVVEDAVNAYKITIKYEAETPSGALCLT